MCNKNMAKVGMSPACVWGQAQNHSYLDGSAVQVMSVSGQILRGATYLPLISLLLRVRR